MHNADINKLNGLDDDFYTKVVREWFNHGTPTLSYETGISDNTGYHLIGVKIDVWSDGTNLEVLVRHSKSQFVIGRYTASTIKAVELAIQARVAPEDLTARLDQLEKVITELSEVVYRTHSKDQ